jgi:hypothetical protein
MRKWPNRIQAWRSRRELRSLQWWERERAYGKSRFIWRGALTLGVTAAAVSDVFHHISGGETDNLLFIAISYTIVGIVTGSFAWDSWETKYKKALKAHVEASSSGRALPHRDVKQVSN